MGRFITDADTRRARKSVGDPRCRASSVASEYRSAHGIKFAGGRARSDGLHHGLAGFGDNATSTKECIEIFLLVNRHLDILRRTVTPPPGDRAQVNTWLAATLTGDSSQLMGDLEDVAERISHHGPTVPRRPFPAALPARRHRHRALGGRPRPRHRHRRTRRPGTDPAQLRVRPSPASPRSLSRQGDPARESPWRRTPSEESSLGRPHPRRQYGELSSGSPAEHSTRARPSIPPSRCVLRYSHWFITTWTRMPPCHLVNYQVHRPRPAKYESSWPSSRTPDIPTFAMHAVQWDLPSVRPEASSPATKRRHSSPSYWTQGLMGALPSQHQHGDNPRRINSSARYARNSSLVNFVVAAGPSRSPRSCGDYSELTQKAVSILSVGNTPRSHNLNRAHRDRIGALDMISTVHQAVTKPKIPRLSLGRR